MNKWCKNEIEEMLVSVSKTKTSKEVAEIFDIILTPREINDMARRHKITEMLVDGHSYSDISMKLGVSSSIISRVSNKVGFGFRRSQSTVSEKKESVTRKESRKAPIKYKSATPIHRIIKGS